MFNTPFFQAGPPVSSAQKPVIVFLHGLFGGLGNFEKTAALLQDQFPVLIPKLPLFESGTTKPTLADLLWWLDQFLSEIDAQKYCLVGNSLGGQLACLYTAFRPERVHSLVLTGAAGMGELSIGASRPKRFDPEYIREKARLTFFDFQPDQQLVDDIQSIIKNQESLFRLLAISRDSMRTKLSGLLYKIVCPVLLIWGENDRITPIASCKAFESELSQAETLIIPNCGHAPMMEHPEIFAIALASFLNNHFENSLIQKHENYSSHT